MQHATAWHAHLICCTIAREAIRSKRLPVQARDLLGVSPRECTNIGHPAILARGRCGMQLLRHAAAWHAHLICCTIERDTLRSKRLPVQARDLLGVSPRGCTAVAHPTLSQDYSHRHAVHTSRITLSIHTYVRARARGCADVSLPEHASARPCGHRGIAPRKAAAVQPVRCINAAPEISRFAVLSGTDSARMPARPGATLCIRQRSAARCGMPCLQRMWPFHRRYTKKPPERSNAPTACLWLLLAWQGAQPTERMASCADMRVARLAGM